MKKEQKPETNNAGAPANEEPLTEMVVEPAETAPDSAEEMVKVDDAAEAVELLKAVCEAKRWERLEKRVKTMGMLEDGFQNLCKRFKGVATEAFPKWLKAAALAARNRLIIAVGFVPTADEEAELKAAMKAGE